MKIVRKYNDPSNILTNIPDNFDYGLKIGKEYMAMGMLTFKKSNQLHFLIDENGRPGWFPNQIFSIASNELPPNWFVRINENRSDVDFYNLIGFDELCNNEDFFNCLLEREEDTMIIYFRRKIEREQIF